MKIESYLDKFNINSKCFLLFTMTPKGNYPLRSYGREFDNYVEHIFNKKEKYIGIFDGDRKEILQDVAFKLFTMPLIGDLYRLRDRIKEEQPRASADHIIAYFVLKEFYDTVPSGKLSEEDSIKIGMEKGARFIEENPLDEFEITISKHSRNEDGVQYLHDLEFNFSEGYWFDSVYAN